MPAFTEPTAILSDLPRVDGSATFSLDGYTIIGSVNGPIEVQRRDELPEEAVVDVIVRPASGVGGKKNLRNYEFLSDDYRNSGATPRIDPTIDSATSDFNPQLSANFNTGHITDRTNTWKRHSKGQVISGFCSKTFISGIDPVSRLICCLQNLPILPALVQTSILALLSAALPLVVTLTSTLLVINGEGPSRSIIQHATPVQIQQAKSVHVFAFTSHGDLVLNESEGNFDLEDWDDLYDLAKKICCGSAADADADPDAMRDEGPDEDDGGLNQFVKSVIEEKVTADLYWRG